MKALDALRVTRRRTRCCVSRRRTGARRWGTTRCLEAFRAGDCLRARAAPRSTCASTAQDDPETPYKNIVALNEHAATLHHVRTRSTRARRRSRCSSTRARYQGYCSDVTRTWVKGTGATARGVRGAGRGGRGDAAAAVRGDGDRHASTSSCTTSRTGRSRRSCATWGSRRSPRRSWSTPASRARSTRTASATRSGSQCHDVGCALAEAARGQPVPPEHVAASTCGQVFTIEPGVYFIEPLLAPRAREGRTSGHRLEAGGGAARKLGGVRIEDDVVVLGGGEEDAESAAGSSSRHRSRGLRFGKTLDHERFLERVRLTGRRRTARRRRTAAPEPCRRRAPVPTFCTLGLGHVYAGRPRRALAWWSPLLVTSLAMPFLAYGLSPVLLGLLVAGNVVTCIAAIIQPSRDRVRLHPPARAAMAPLRVLGRGQPRHGHDRVRRARLRGQGVQYSGLD